MGDRVLGSPKEKSKIPLDGQISDLSLGLSKYKGDSLNALPGPSGKAVCFYLGLTQMRLDKCVHIWLFFMKVHSFS